MVSMPSREIRVGIHTGLHKEYANTGIAVHADDPVQLSSTACSLLLPTPCYVLYAAAQIARQAK